jgi:hypothetical protein
LSGLPLLLLMLLGAHVTITSPCASACSTAHACASASVCACRMRAGLQAPAAPGAPTELTLWHCGDTANPPLPVPPGSRTAGVRAWSRPCCCRQL